MNIEIKLFSIIKKIKQIFKIKNNINLDNKTEKKFVEDLSIKFDFKYIFDYIIKKGVTPTRYLQDKFIEFYLPKIEGKILELGSGDKNTSKNLAISCSEFIKSDLYPIKEDVIQIDAQNINFKKNSLDCIVCVSMLEHIYDYQKVINEIYRVLKPGGKFIFATPYMYPYHPSCEDHFRYSPMAYEKMLFKFSNVKIYGLGNADLTTALCLKRKRYHENFVHLNKKNSLINHILSCIYLIKGLYRYKNDDYMQLVAGVAIK